MRHFFIGFILLIATWVNAKEFVFTGENQNIPIGNYLQYLHTETSIKADSVVRSKAFQNSNNQVPNFGISDEEIWLKIQIKNQTQDPNLVLRVAYPILDRVSLFYENNANWQIIEYLKTTEPKKRQRKESGYAFNIKVLQGQTKAFYLRIKNTEQIITPVFVTTSDFWWESVKFETGVSAFYAGVILIMLFYNLFVYFSVRDKSYIYYVLYLLFIGLTQLGIKGAIPFVIPDLVPGFHSFGLTLFGSMGALFGVVFTRRFLHTTVNLPRIDIVLKGLVAVFILSSALAIFGIVSAGFQLMQLGTSVSAITIFVAAILAIRKKVNSAFFFTVAWFILLVGAIIFLLKDVGILPYNIFTNHIMLIASVVEMSLLSFALADKINVLQVENRAARERELAVLKENQELIHEQNILLEKKVTERTLDLKNANESLENTLNTLKNAQSQLVSQEKMASLGQLTAGIAHEINNPINFVSSNVGPLRRDIDDLIGVIEKYDELSEEERFREMKIIIDRFKDEIEYSYLLEEIEQLLTGIQEGAGRTSEIVKSLKNFSRLDEIESKTADIHEGLRSTILILKSGTKKNVPINTNFDESIQPVQCYPGKLNQVFSNLIINAIQALTDGDSPVENPEINICTNQSEDDIIIEIEDNGPGIPKEMQERIFEPFFTTKEVGEGTGLGLSIVFSIIESHQGKIEVESKQNEGTKFIITLPKELDK